MMHRAAVAAVAAAVALVPLAAGAQAKAGAPTMRTHTPAKPVAGGSLPGTGGFLTFARHRRFIFIVPLLQDTIQCEAADGYVRAANYQDTWDTSDTLVADFRSDSGALSLLRALRRSGYTDAAIVNSSVLPDGFTHVEYRLGTRRDMNTC